MKLNGKTLMILLALFAGAVTVSGSTWGVISIADNRYASSHKLTRTNMVLEEHILESKQIHLSAQLTTVLVRLADLPRNANLIRQKVELEKAMNPIYTKLEDVRARLRQ